MKNLVTAVALTAGVLAFGATSASAAIVCNEQGDCWKTKEKYAYPSDARVRIYADDWKWGPNDKYRMAGARGPRLLGAERRLARVLVQAI